MRRLLALSAIDPRIAFTGVDWGVDEAVVRLSRAGTIPPVIVVGVWNSAERGTENSPWHRAGSYARFLIEELMTEGAGLSLRLRPFASLRVTGLA